MSFSQIKNEFGNIDSPALSYHLKSLKIFIEQKDAQYKLTETGNAALLLLSKLDQSTKLTTYKKRFLYANIATICCWTAMMIIVSNLVGPDLSRTNAILSIILFQLFAQLNYQIIFQIWGRTWYVKKKKAIDDTSQIPNAESKTESKIQK